MNVTVKMDTALCKEARHRAVDAGVSLSAWLAALVEAELHRTPAGRSEGLLESLSMDDFEDRSFDAPRDDSTSRELRFS